MKKRILLVTFIMALFMQANAQSKTFNFGVKVAPAISWLGIDEPNISGNGSKAKFNWGFIGAYNFSDNFALVSGFNINSLGGKYKANDTSYKMKCTEFQIPVTFQMKTNEVGEFKFYGQIGLAEGFLFNGKDGDSHSITKYLRTFNSSFIVAGGVEYGISGGVDLIGQIKYNGGLSSIFKKKDYDFKAKANFIELGIGVMF